MSESKANLPRHRGNHTQTLTILGSTVKSPVDVCLAGSPTPANPERVFFSGAIPVRFFSRRGGGGEAGWVAVRQAFIHASSHAVVTTTVPNPLWTRFHDARDVSKMLRTGLWGASKTISNASCIQVLHYLCVRIVHSWLCSTPNEYANC